MVDVKSLSGLTQDSRQVREGYLFAALPGTKQDGRRYIADAIRYGARVILAPEGTTLPDEAQGVALITDANPRRLFAQMAAEFYGLQPEYIVAVTGTNGKTSCAHFVKQLWKMQGLVAGSIGTLGVRGPHGSEGPTKGLIRSASMTTPDPVALHATLADMAAVKVTHLAMEASSHGLDQRRLDGVKVRAAGFTNLSRDHLDYHPDMDAYLAAKTRLFSEIVMDGGVAVLNADAPEYEALKAVCKVRGLRVLSYGSAGVELKLVGAEPHPHGQHIVFEVFGVRYEVDLPLVGAFQVMNVLCALGLVVSEEGGDISAFVSGLSKLHGAPGRVELVSGHPHGAAVYIDYAHTPDALETVLKALRPHVGEGGRLVCLFGCGGDRDRGKRPIMGKIAIDHADIVVVSDDNPRGEDPASIRAHVLEGAVGAREIGGRAGAIKQTITELTEGDVLVIAGKGHEQGQVFADRTEPFDDFKEAQKAIEELAS